MKFVVFGPERRVGLIINNKILDVSGAFAKRLRERENEPNPLALANALAPPKLTAFIEGGERALDNAQRAAEYVTTEAGDMLGVNGEEVFFDVDDVYLHAPRPHGRIACAGGNYYAHSRGMALSRGEQTTVDEHRARGMWGFWKVSHETLGPRGEMIYPSRARHLDYEGEAAIVIGRSGKNIRSSDALSHVWGVTLLIDWSIRGDDESSRSSFAFRKNFDTSISLGPCIAVNEVSPSAVDVETIVNGEQRQSYNSVDMVYSFEEYIEFLSRDFTLLSGDIISGGTGPGTAMDSSHSDSDGTTHDYFLRVGDLVDVSSPQIGDISNKLVSDDAP